MERGNFRSEENIPRMQRSINYMPTSTSTARICASQNRGSTRKSPVQIKSGTIFSTETISRFAVRSEGDLIHSVHYL